MFKHQKIQTLDDFFTEMDKRREKGVYFYRINTYNSAVDGFIRKYYENARLSGVVIEGKIPNPDEKNLAYYQEIMGTSFTLSQDFIAQRLKKWLPRMNDYQRNNVASSVYELLVGLQKAGKTENMIKNAYVKFMCWLYYKFERIVNALGDNKVPKILYEGAISNYELLLISVLCHAGCDVVLLQHAGDAGYLALDPGSVYSEALVLADAGPIPPAFTLKAVREQLQSDAQSARLYGQKPKYLNCTNAWITGRLMEDVKKVVALRGDDPNLFYTVFGRINGVEDKITYVNDLYQMYLELKNNKRRLVIVEGKLPQPSNQEIATIHRSNYTRQDQMFSELITNIKYSASMDLQRLMVKAFLDVMLEEAKAPENTINKLVNKAVYLLCWLSRYQSQLFGNWKNPEVGCFILLGVCETDVEALFLKMLSRLPTDVLLLNPSLAKKCCLEDKLLFDENHTVTLNVPHFPIENAELKIGTAAYHAERDLDEIMYQGSGIYRNQQYQKANVVQLQTMYEEIAILWDQELKYRPNFTVVDDVVTIPVIFAKVSGVKDGLLPGYWSGIRKLMTEDTFVIRKAPFIPNRSPNPMSAIAPEVYRNRRLQRDKLKQHPSYPYGFLREEIQNHILDKLQILIDQKLIKGTFENGTEYTIIATVLNIPKELLRMIQKFDFTKKNPKVLYIHTDETIISLEDSILMSFLSLAGFDVVFFVPTGYQNVENHYNKKVMEEHQIGDYMYDLQIPDMKKLPSDTRPKSWREKIFKRGT